MAKKPKEEPKKAEPVCSTEEQALCVENMRLKDRLTERCDGK